MSNVVPLFWRGCQESVVLFKDLYERALRGEIPSAAVTLETAHGMEFLFAGRLRVDAARALDAAESMALYLRCAADASNS